MENVVDCVLRNLVDSRSDIFTCDSSYCRFKLENDYDWNLGFQSSALFGRIVYERDGKSYFSEPMVLKMSPKTSLFSHRQYLQRFTFDNEISFYVNLVPLFDSFRPCTLFPKFFNSLIESDVNLNRAVIVFQNLQALNYTLSKRKSFLDINHLRLMVRKLGEFHAYSFKSRHDDENKFRMMVTSMRTVQVETLRENKDVFVMLGERGIAPFASDAMYKDKVIVARKKLAQLDETVYDVLNGVTNDEQDVLVLCHGDYLCSNILFQYGGENGIPIDMKMVDMANCRMASPVVDLALVLYMHTTQTIRDQYWNELIDEYYTALKTTFPQIAVPSLQQIWREFRCRAFHVYFIASFFLGSLIARDEDLPQIFDQWPEKYRHSEYASIPNEVRCQGYMKLGGQKTTEALVDMLKDMINRGFV